MPTITQPPFTGEADRASMAGLARAWPADHLHVVDLPYRLCSWALDDPENVGLWVDAAGELVAWAVLQSPFWAIDVTCSPAVERDLYPTLLAWADARARRARGTPYERPAWYVNVFEDQAGRRLDLEAAGFARQADAGEDSWSKVFMRRDGPPPSEPPAPSLPPGFCLRPLAGQAEVDAYVELQREVFGSKNMTAGWRSRTLAHPDYRPELDVVVAAPDGRLAAFCIGWIHGTTGQVEPLGAREEYRGLGLGRAVLWEGLRRLHRAGAETMVVETDSFRGPALALYESAGFRVVRDVLVYRKEYDTE